MRKIMKMMMVVLTLGVLVGCGAKKVDIDEGKVSEKADMVIKLYNEENFEKLHEMGSEKLKSAISVDGLKEAEENIEKELGKFKEVKERKFGEKDGMVLCVTLSEFEKGQGQIQTAFNENLELEGFAIVK
ncbi:MAG: DUF3887 domain-containing protein [Clostridium sp.]|uniref:DUF3887 domain-containing protein n=1 Tax=Clostridium sp. TaxID=1506 RepID=UPI003EE4AECF